MKPARFSIMAIFLLIFAAGCGNGVLAPDGDGPSGRSFNAGENSDYIDPDIDPATPKADPPAADSETDYIDPDIDPATPKANPPAADSETDYIDPDIDPA